jgi:lipopolysaccharide export system protein LptA
MKSLVTATIFAAALLGGGAHAVAQGLDPASSGEPFDITADELEVQNRACVSVWKGNAEALQGKARLRADILRAFFETKAGAAASGPTGTGACGDLLRLEAEGKVYYVTAKDQRVTGNTGVYDATTELVTLTGDVVAVQGQNVLRGSKMVFNNKTGEGRMVGNAKGPNAKDRPRGVFYPSKKTESASR